MARELERTSSRSRGDQRRHGIGAAIRWLGRHEFGLLLTLVVLSLGTWGTVELVGEVLEGSTRALDRRILLLLREADDVTDPIGPRWVEEMMRDVTALGGTVVLTMLSLIVAGYLGLRRASRTVLFMVFAIGGGNGLVYLLKHLFERPRPDLVPHGTEVYTASFPSAHSMMSAVTYLTLAVLLAAVDSRCRVKAYVLLVALFLTLIVGVSRVYMGVHWPTDVVAGWAIGALWAAMCWWIVRVLQLRGTLERDAGFL